MSEINDDELLSKARDDRVALEKLILRHYDRLLRFVHGRLPMWMERLVSADDVVQETCARIFKNIQTFNPQGQDSFFAWSSRIAENYINNLVDFYRAKKRYAGAGEMTLDNAVDETAVAMLWKWSRGEKRPSDMAADQEKVKQLSVCLKKLDPVHLEVIQHRFLEGRTTRNTAQAMGRTERAVEQLVFRAIRQLRALFPRSKP